jgi:predicted aspartyl protease
MVIRWYLSVFFLSAAAPAYGETVNTELSFRLDPQGGVVVLAAVQGAGPFPFLLDTGSSHSAISDDLARELALRTIARADLQTSTGRTVVAVVDIEAVSVGAATSRIQASVLAAMALRVIGADIRGVLGRDFLSVHHFTIDYSRRRLRWDDLGEGLESPIGKSIRVPLVEEDGRFVMQAAQRDCQTLRLVADTGSSELVLFESERLTRLALTPASGLPQMLLSSLSGSQSVRLMRVPRLAVGGLMLRNRLAVVLPPATSVYSSIDGLLPLHTFHAVSFRQRDGYVLISQ